MAIIVVHLVFELFDAVSCFLFWLVNSKYCSCGDTIRTFLCAWERCQVYGDSSELFSKDIRLY